MTDFNRLLRTFHDAGLEFAIIGGVAGNIYGVARVTYDLDIIYRRSSDNIARLVQSLAPLNPYPRGAPPGLPFLWDEETVKRGLNFTLSCSLGDIDIFGEISGAGTYEEIALDASIAELGGVGVRVISIEKLILAKRAAGRPKDFEAIAELEALREE